MVRAGVNGAWWARSLLGQNNQLDPASYYGCYLLRSLDPQYVDHCYIGFTVDPRRRVDQHNGLLEGGAKKTSRKRPWEMVLTVFGFPSKVAALRFEWCWQNPTESLLTRDGLEAVPVGERKRERLRPKVRVLYAMLHMAPFNRFPLTVFWLLKDREQFRVLLEGCAPPPPHMTVLNACNGSANASGFDSLYCYNLDEWLQPRRKKPNAGQADAELELLCDICFGPLPDLANEEHIECPHDYCWMRCHVACLATRLLQGAGEADVQIVPTHGACPGCGNRVTWGELVMDRQKRRRVALQAANVTL